jgi:hypothetical protein
MSPKYIATTAAIALAVVLAHQHFATGGSLKPRIGN